MKQYIYTIILCLMALLSHAQSDPAPKPPFSTVSIQGFAKISSGDTIHTGYQSGFGFFNIAGRSWVAKNFPFRHDSLTAINYSAFLNQSGQLAQIPYLNFDGNEFTVSKPLYMSGLQPGINFKPPSGAAGNYAVITQDDTTLSFYRSGHTGAALDGQITVYGNNLKDGNGVRFAKMSDIPVLSGYITTNGPNQTINQHPTLQGGATFGYMTNISGDQSSSTPDGINIAPGKDATTIQISGRNGLGLLGVYSGKTIATFNDNNSLADSSNIAFYFPVTLGYDIAANTDTGATILLQEDRTLPGNTGRISGMKLSRLATASSLAGYVPYNGATSGINLGSQAITSTGGHIAFSGSGAVITHSFMDNGSMYVTSSNGNILNLYAGYTDNPSLVYQFSTGYGFLKWDDITANRTIQLPNANGTVALTSDITAIVSSYVPYTGATSDLKLGSNNLELGSDMPITSNPNSPNGGILKANPVSLDIHLYGRNGLTITSSAAAKIASFEDTQPDADAPGIRFYKPLFLDYTLPSYSSSGDTVLIQDQKGVPGAQGLIKGLPLSYFATSAALSTYVPVTGSSSDIRLGNHYYYTNYAFIAGPSNSANTAIFNQNSINFNDSNSSFQATYCRNFLEIYDTVSKQQVQVNPNTGMVAKTNITLPAVSGTIALISDIPGGSAGLSATAPLNYNNSTGLFTLTQDSSPASGSENPVTSGGVFTALAGKQAAGNYITALTGDGTATGPGSATFTLATINSNVGTYNNVTVNAKGLITAASNISYQTPISLTTSGTSGAATLVSNTLNIPNYSVSNSDGSLIISGSVVNINAAHNNTWSALQSFTGNLSTNTGTIANAFFIGGTGYSTAQTIPNILFGGSTSIQAHGWFDGNGSAALGNNLSAANIIFGTPTLATSSTGTYPVLANAVFNPVSIISGGAAITTTASVYINGATTGGTSNWALDVASGNTLLGGNLSLSGALALNNSGSSINGSTSGTASFNETFNGSSEKHCIITLSSLNGSATYTFPTTFNNTPVVIASNGLSASLVTSLSTTSATVTTSSATSGTLIIIGN